MIYNINKGLLCNRMSHNEPRSGYLQEAWLSLISGLIYGGVNTLVGHPLDTVKTKMQAQSDVLQSKQSLLGIIKHVIRNDGGAMGLYRGCVPPFIGSIIYRSL